MSGEKTAEQISLEIVGPLPVPGQRKWTAGLSKQDLIIKAMQVYADQQNAALKEALSECVVFAQVYRNTLKRKQEKEPHSNGWRVQIESMNEIIDKASALLNKQPQSESDGDKNL